MKKTVLQRYTLLLFFYTLLTRFFLVLASSFEWIKNNVMVSQGMSLAIDFNVNNAGIATILFVLQFIFNYLFLACSWIVVAFALGVLIAWIFEIIKNKKFNPLVLLVLVSIGFVFFLPFNAWSLLCILGIIILYLPTYLLNISLFEMDNVRDWINGYKTLLLKQPKEVMSFNTRNWDYLKKTKCESYDGDLYVTMAVNVLLALGSVFSFGLLSGLLIYIKDNYQINHTYISGKKLIYQSPWYVWLFKGVKWTVLTIFTLGIYPLCGALTLDYFTTRYSFTHFVDSSSEQSFFDGRLGEYAFYHILGILGFCCTLGIAYPYVRRYVLNYLSNHSVIDGHRLTLVNDLKDDYSNFKVDYPLFICTFGLISVVYSYIYQCYTKDHILIDLNPTLYSEDESFEESNVSFHSWTTQISVLTPEVIAAYEADTKGINPVSEQIKNDQQEVKSSQEVKKPSKKSSSKAKTKPVKQSTHDAQGKRILKRKTSNTNGIKTVKKTTNGKNSTASTSKVNSSVKVNQKVEQAKPVAPTNNANETVKTNIQSKNVNKKNHKATKQQPIKYSKAVKNNGTMNNRVVLVANKDVARKLKRKK